MDIWAIIIGIGVVVGIIAGVVQVIDFIQKQRQPKKSKPVSAREAPEAIPDVPVNLPPGSEILHNLPPRNVFVGRKDEKIRGHQALLSRSYLISIEGIGGVGKTALALEIAHECLEASQCGKPSDRIATFRGFIWATAKDQGLVLDNLLDEVARTLGHAVVMKQPLEEKRNSVIRLFQGRPCLLIMDNFESVTDEAVRDFLLKLPEPSKVLLTTREQKMSQAWSISLKGLPDVDALELIRSHGSSLGLQAIEHAEEAVLMRLCRATGGLPLATQWALGQIKQKGQSLDTVLEFLYEAKGNIFDHIFLRSWKLLSPDAQRVLCIMPIFASDASQPAIEAASGVYGFAFDEALGQLVEMSLVNTTDSLDLAQRRYSVHPLTRVFASAKLEAAIAHQANKHLADFFEDYTRAVGGLWNLEGFEKLKPDLLNLIATIQWCWREQLIELGINIFDNTRYFFMNYGRWNTALSLAQEAIKLIAFESGRPPGRLTEWQTKAVRFRIWPVAWIYRLRGHLDIAKNEIKQALEIFEHAGDKDNAAYAKRHLSLVLQFLGEMENAERLLREALEFSASMQDSYRVQLLTADLAVLAVTQGDLNKAWQMSSIVLDPLHQITDLQCVATFYRVLGSVARQRGNLDQAKELCEKALNYTEQLKYRNGIADALFELAQVEIEMGQKQAVHERYERAREIYQELGMEHQIRQIENALTKLLENDNASK